ncbi:MAG TPA: 50S ribosomal protein L21 [Limnochordia bacterium]
MQAIVESGGKQYRVAPGETIDVERLELPADATVEIDRVLWVRDGDQVKIGDPVVPGARVIARVQRHGRGRKIRVFTYKPKKNQRRRLGHRQAFTRLVIERIETD